MQYWGLRRTQSFKNTHTNVLSILFLSLVSYLNYEFPAKISSNWYENIDFWRENSNKRSSHRSQTYSHKLWLFEWFQELCWNKTKVCRFARKRGPILRIWLSFRHFMCFWVQRDNIDEKWWQKVTYMFLCFGTQRHFCTVIEDCCRLDCSWILLYHSTTCVIIIGCDLLKERFFCG